MRESLGSLRSRELRAVVGEVLLPSITLALATRGRLSHPRSRTHRPGHSSPTLIDPMRLPSIGLLVATSVTFLLAACASSHHAAPGSTSTTSSSTKSSSGRETFSAEQLSSTAAANIYDAINTLKPEVLTGRGRGAPDVYVGAVKQQTGVDRLKELSLTGLHDVTYLRYDQARNLTDAQSPGGAIVITLQ